MNPSKPETSSSQLTAAAPLVHLSQGQLNLLSTCSRKFQHVYLEQLASPHPLEQQERQRAGAQFHSLMQQWHLDLPIAPFLEADTQLQHWFNAFMAAAPEILDLDDITLRSTTTEAQRQSEHQRTLEFEGYLLTVVYDLLLTSDRQAQILDWKTYPRPQRSDWLRQNWQTRLYPFVLVETSGYSPEQVSMVYWFFQSKDTALPQSLKFPYDVTQHEATRRDLTQLLHQLTQWLEGYQAGISFPQVTLGSRACEGCSFASRCDRLNPDPLDSSALPALADIPEVRL